MKKTLPQTFLNTFLCCCFSVPKSHPTLCDPRDYSMPCFPGLHYCPEFAHTNAHWVNDAIHPFHSLLPCLLLSSIFPASGSFPIESTLGIKWPKYWSFSFSISPSCEYSGLISFRMDWVDLLAVQETLKSLFQYHISKTSILWRSAFFMVQLSHPYMTTGKTIALTTWTFFDKVSAF